MAKKSTPAPQFTVANRINVMGTIAVSMANINGDPMFGNNPRRTSGDFGLMTDMCQKYKIRRRVVDLADGKKGYELFYSDDGNTLDEKVAAFNSPDGFDVDGLCAKYFDLRAFGGVLIGDAIDNDGDETADEKPKNSKPRSTSKPPQTQPAQPATKKKRKTDSVTGCVTINLATSLDPINIIDMQITRCCDQNKKDKTTMGTKAVVENATYVFFATVNARMAKKNGFTDSDFAIMLDAIKTMFIGDESAARPAGSTDMDSLFVMQHSTIDGNESDRRIKARLRNKNGKVSVDDTNMDGIEVHRII